MSDEIGSVVSECVRRVVMRFVASLVANISVDTIVVWYTQVIIMLWWAREALLKR